MKKKNPRKSEYLISYMTLRKAIGILGVLFPIILVIGTIVACGYDHILGSISEYYHSVMRNIFVGILCAIALFLFSYRGYNQIDNIMGNLACLFALGVAFFPMSLGPSDLIDKIHFTSAALLFLTLSFFSLFLFTKTKDNNKMTKLKRHRNRVYITCGIIMLGCILLISSYFIFELHQYLVIYNLKPIFWLETFALWAFGVSWLTKGQAILSDEKE